MSASLNNKLRHARDLLQNGDANGARELCSQILGKAPRNPEALTLRGIAALMGGAAADAARDFRQALAAAPRDGAALEYLGLALLNLGDFAEAENVLQRASTLSGAPASVWMRLGLAVLHQGRAQESLAALKKAVALAPGNVDCLISLGRAMAAAGDAPGATAQFESVLSLAPGHPDAAYNLGVVRLDANDLAGARQLFADVLTHAPRNTDAMVNLAIVLERDGAPDAAADMLQRVLAIEPQHPHALANLGRLEFVRGNLASAKAHYENALRQAPPLIAAIEGMATVCRAQGRYAEAVHWFRELTRREPALPTGWAALADNLLQTGDLDAADEAARKAGDLDPALASPYALRAQLRVLRGKLDEAVAILDEGFRKTDGTGLLGMLAQQCRHTCDWDRWSAAWLALKPRIIAGEDAGTPFALLSEDLTSRQLLDYTRTWANKRFGHPPAEKPVGHATRGDRPVRIGYLSSDFQEHPVAFLIAEVLELHDRSRFEVYAYSYGPPGTGAMRQRMISAVDHFVDIAWEPDDQAIERIRNDEIDILVDLKGYTVGDRLAIMAQRPSPVQVTWLGYPGTTGTAFIDYLIADPFIVPAGAEHTCSEQVVRHAALLPAHRPQARHRRPAATVGLWPAGRRSGVLLFQPDLQDYAGHICSLDAPAGRDPRQRAVADGRQSLGHGQSAQRGGGSRHRAGSAWCLRPACRSPNISRATRSRIWLWTRSPTLPTPRPATRSGAAARSSHCVAKRLRPGYPAASSPPPACPTWSPTRFRNARPRCWNSPPMPRLRQEVVDRVQTARTQAPLFDATAFARDLEALYLQMLDQQPATA